MWHFLGDGRGSKEMVVIPYKDRLALFSRYLQQLVMESLGKEVDRQGQTVNQGITVYGNKGSTDQHAYVQQLREGLADFFLTFVQVLQDRDGSSIDVEPQITTGDYLFGFLQGTRQALYENGRQSLTMTVDRLDERSLGALIALFERAVGLYAELIDINAYHQPGVEAGKKAAAAVLDLQNRVVGALRESDRAQTAEQIAASLGESERVETIYKILQHLAANADRRLTRVAAGNPRDEQFQAGP
jgi:glucose-6-phosphate isomerase